MKREPAVIIGILISALSAAQAAATGSTSWRDYVVRGTPALAGVLIRAFVTPTSRSS